MDFFSCIFLFKSFIVVPSLSLFLLFFSVSLVFFDFSIFHLNFFLTHLFLTHSVTELFVALFYFYITYNAINIVNWLRLYERFTKLYYKRTKEIVVYQRSSHQYNCNRFEFYSFCMCKKCFYVYIQWKTVFGTMFQCLCICAKANNILLF